MKFKDIVIGIFVISVIVLVGYFVHQQADRRTNRELARRIAELSPRGGPPETIEGLRKAIALYQDQIERHVRDAAQTGAFWKILGTRLAERGMHHEALAAFERAISFNATDAFLFYMTGVSAGHVAKSQVGFSADSGLDREGYFRLSENAYLRALELDDRYARPMYGLGILYVFELDRPAEAIPHLERLLELQPSNFSAMFVLARAYFMIGEHRQAIELYDRIAARTRNNREREGALINREIVSRMMHE